MKRFVLDIILLKNAMRSATNWKPIKNEVMQWKAVLIVYRPTKEIFFQSISRYELLLKILKFYFLANHG